MENSSREFMFVLHGLNETRTNKYIYFAFGLVVYIETLLVNLTLIITIILDKTLHEPMYLFICNLYVNGIGLNDRNRALIIIFMWLFCKRRPAGDGLGLQLAPC